MATDKTEVKPEQKTDTKVEAKPAVQQKVETLKEPTVKLVVTIYGRMVDPLTGEVYEQTPKELVKPTGWVTSQVEAGKMAFLA